MKLETASTAGSKILLIVGWFFSAIPILLMGVGGSLMLLTSPAAAAKGLEAHGYPSHLVTTIISLEIACAVLYAIPRTAVLGAILMTGYLGGATATHVRVGEIQWVFPVIFGVIAWLGLFLRDRRLRELLILRR